MGHEARGAELRQARLARPEELAGAADLEVDLGEPEPVLRGFHGREALLALVGRGAAREQDAERLGGPAADAAAQLVELGQAEALGVLDQHHRRVGHVDPDLDHRRRNQQVELAGLERPHDPFLRVEPEPPVDQAHPEPLERAAPEALRHLGRGLQIARLGLLDERADHVGLAAGLELASDELVDPLPLGLVANLGHDRRPPGRQLVEHGDVEIAVERQGQGAGDRGRRHDQHVRVLALPAERRALEHAEPVLLVDDGEPEALELHRVLDEGVGADTDGRGAAAERLQGRLPLPAPLAGGEPRHGEPERLDERAHRPEVLLGEDLGGRHEHRLRARFHGRQERHHGDDRLAGADIPLEQPVHGHRAPQVRPDLRPDALLRRGQGERELAQESRDEVAGGRERPAVLARLPPALDREPDLEHEEVLEGEPPAGFLDVLERARESGPRGTPPPPG